MDSILISVKKMLGISEEDTHFDSEIILNINSVLMILNQLGVCETCVSIESDSETWSDVLGNRTDLALVKTYVYLKVRALFDPPTSSYVLDSMERQITQFEWRLNAQVEKDTPEEVVEDDE